jgi:hypothetical protein
MKRSRSKLRSGIYSRLLVVIACCHVLSSGLAQQWSPITNNNIYNLNTGNVGIGSAAPVFKLEVTSPSNARLLIKSTLAANPALLEINAPSAVGVFETVTSPSPMTRIGSRLNQDFALFSYNTDRLVLKGDGRIGIGKSNPVYTLDVGGVINASALLINSQPINQSQWTTSGANISFNSGIVSVGTITPPAGYKLAVGGKIISEEIVVKLQANWPDYVFGKDYKLPSLAELSLFIRRQKRLPGVPAARDIERDGLTVGEMNVILLKKIEELTLYIIQQEERLSFLERNQSKR